jgi:hypothetical protein
LGPNVKAPTDCGTGPTSGGLAAIGRAGVEPTATAKTAASKPIRYVKRILLLLQTLRIVYRRLYEADVKGAYITGSFWFLVFGFWFLVFGFWFWVLGSGFWVFRFSNQTNNSKPKLKTKNSEPKTKNQKRTGVHSRSL